MKLRLLIIMFAVVCLLSGLGDSAYGTPTARISFEPDREVTTLPDVTDTVVSVFIDLSDAASATAVHCELAWAASASGVVSHIMAGGPRSASVGWVERARTVSTTSSRGTIVNAEPSPDGRLQFYWPLSLRAFPEGAAIRFWVNRLTIVPREGREEGAILLNSLTIGRPGSAPPAVRAETMSPSTVREGSWPDQLTLFGASLDAVTQVRLAGLSDTLTTGSIQSSARGERLDVAMEANDIDVGRYRVILITATGQAIGGPAFAVTPRREIASYMTSKGLVELREATDRILVRFRGDVPEQSADDLLLRVTGDRGREAGGQYHRVVSVSDLEAQLDSLRAPEIVEYARPVLTFADGRYVYADNRISIGFVATTSDERIDSLFTALGLTVIHYDRRRLAEYDVTLPWTRADSVFTIARQIDALPYVEFAHPTFFMQLKAHTVNDPYRPQQWYLNNTQADSGWTFTTGSDNTYLAIIDSGIDRDHIEFWNRYAGGWDFVQDDFDPDISCPGNGYSPLRAHGTAVAGIAAAQGNNGAGIAGLAFGCKIKVYRAMTTDEYGEFSADAPWIRDAIYRADDDGASVISLSIGGDEVSSIANAIYEVTHFGRDYPTYDLGVVFVASAGNDSGSIEWPANREDCIAVGAVNMADVRWDYSCTGSELDVVAPSGYLNGLGDMFTTDVLDTCGFDYTEYFASFGGTSAAAPQVAALAALILSKAPEFTRSEVESLIEASCDPIGSIWEYGAGKINAGRTLWNLTSQFDPSVDYPVSGVVWTAGQQVTIEWTEECTHCDIEGFDVYLGRSGAPLESLGTVGPTVRELSWTVTPPAANDCFIEVRVRNTHGAEAIAQRGTFTIIVPDQGWHEVTQALIQGPSSSSGCSWVDYDSDGDSDLYVASLGGGNKLFRYDSNTNAFADATTGLLAYNGIARSTVWGDLDNDGDPDMFMAKGDSGLILRNDGGGNFADITPSTLRTVGFLRMGTFSDVDGDRLLDLYITRTTSSSLLYKNLGSGVFVDVSAAPLNVGTFSGCAAWCDFDSDRDQDVVLTRDNSSPSVRLYRNNGTWNFTEVALGAQGPSTAYSAAWGDRNNDGNLDALIGSFGNQWGLINSGSSVTLAPLGITGSGSNTYATSWVDYDNDGDQDVFFIKDDPDRCYIFANNGTGTFTDATPFALQDVQAASAAAWSDFNNDGLVDLYCAGEARNYLFKNESNPTNNWVKVRPIGDPAGFFGSNRGAVGARVRVVTASRTQWREVVAGSGYLSQDSGVLHFGLGTDQSISSLHITFPSGNQRLWVNPPINTLLEMWEGGGTAVPEGQTGRVSISSQPNPFRRHAQVHYAVDREGPVDISVFDATGRLVRRLESGAHRRPGTYDVEFDGNDDNGHGIGAGVYFLQLRSGSIEQNQRVVLVR